MNFGLLRVLNDDIVEPTMGFATHPHDNMEIISYAVAGKIAHKDSAGHTATIGRNQVQFMSAGSGIAHSEFCGLHIHHLQGTGDAVHMAGAAPCPLIGVVVLVDPEQHVGIAFIGGAHAAPLALGLALMGPIAYYKYTSYALGWMGLILLTHAVLAGALPAPVARRVRGLGKGRPSRVPIPAARMVT